MSDGDKYVQCRRTADAALRCEAAGSLMQPSLDRVLTPDKVARLKALNWTLDRSFGNYGRIFAAGTDTAVAAREIVAVLTGVYDADPSRLFPETHWVASAACPPRNGPRQTRAGMVDDDPHMASVAIHTCVSSSPPLFAPPASAHSAQDLIDSYGPRVAGETARLRAHLAERLHVVLDTDVGYVQCAPDPAAFAISCGAAAADSWPDLAKALTPQHAARLHAAGFEDPGRSPNYSIEYPLTKTDDDAVAREVLTILYEVYGYDGRQKLRILTE